MRFPACSVRVRVCVAKHTLCVERQHGLDGDVDSSKLVHLKHDLDEGWGKFSCQPITVLVLSVIFSLI